MKRLLLFAVLSCLALVANAQGQVDAPVPPVEQQAVVTDAEAVAPEATEQAAARELNDRHCLKHTGTRISPRADRNGRKCANAVGRAYNRDDLDRTGAVDLAEALRLLDPAVR